MAVPDPQIEHDDEIQRRRENRALTQIHDAGLPVKWQNLDPAALAPRPGQQAAFGYATAWAAGRLSTPGLLLYGEVGRGKSCQAARATLMYLTASPRHQARWINVPDLLSDLKHPFGSDEWKNATRRLKADAHRPVALILDDFDLIEPTEHQLEPIYRAMNRWLEQGWPMIATSRRDIDGIAKRFSRRDNPLGEPIASRLAEHCTVTEVVGEDHRRPGQVRAG